MGDSITAQHLDSSYVEAWALTRFPAGDLKFFNVGIGRNGAPGGNNRFKRDVLPYAATVTLPEKATDEIASVLCVEVE